MQSGEQTRVREDVGTIRGPMWAVGTACLAAAREDLGFLGLHGTIPEPSGFAHSCSLLQVVEIVKKLESRQRGWEEEEDPERKGTIVFNATSEFCRTLGEIPTYGLAGNREEQEELMVGARQPLRHTDLLCSGLGVGWAEGSAPVVCRDGPGLMLVLCPQDFERDEDRSANGGSESDGEENIGWSTVNLDEEKQHQDVRRGRRGGGWEHGRAGTAQPGGVRGLDWQQVTWCLRASVS